MTRKLSLLKILLTCSTMVLAANAVADKTMHVDVNTCPMKPTDIGVHKKYVDGHSDHIWSLKSDYSFSVPQDVLEIALEPSPHYLKALCGNDWDCQEKIVFTEFGHEWTDAIDGKTIPIEHCPGASPHSWH